MKLMPFIIRQEDKEIANKEIEQGDGCNGKQSDQERFCQSTRLRCERLFRRFLLEPGTELAVETTRHFSLDTGRQPGESIAASEDIWITTVMAFGGFTVAQLYEMIELLNPDRIPIVMILIGINSASRSPESEETRWETLPVCLSTAIWQIFKCTVLTIWTIPMDTRLHLAPTCS